MSLTESRLRDILFKPVYIGDSVRAEATVMSVQHSRPIADIDFVVRNQHGEEVLQGQATVCEARPTSATYPWAWGFAA